MRLHICIFISSLIDTEISQQISIKFDPIWIEGCRNDFTLAWNKPLVFLKQNVFVNA